MSGESEPSININLGSEKFEMTRQNSSLHTFLGRAAMNHIYLVRDDLPSEEEQSVTPLYRDLMTNKNIWDAIAQQMEQKEFPLYLNHPDVSPQTVESYEKIALNQLETEMEKNGDYLPEGWA